MKNIAESLVGLEVWIDNVGYAIELSFSPVIAIYDFFLKLVGLDFL